MEKSKLIKKIVLAILAFAIFATTVNALSYTTVEHTINIQISLEGKDTVIERFYIEFTDENERLAFREKSIALGTNIDEWKKFDLAFVPSLGENTTDKKISYNESARNYLEIDYSLAEPLMVKGKDASMLTEYNLKVNYFNGFYQSGLWIIPDNTTITIELPPGAEINNTVEPLAQITTAGSRKAINWQGYKSANNLSLTYILWKKIQPVIDISSITNFLFKTTQGMLLIVIVLLILAGVIWQRKKIGLGIEEFVEKHSLIKEE